MIVLEEGVTEVVVTGKIGAAGGEGTLGQKPSVKGKRKDRERERKSDSILVGSREGLLRIARG
jgi:hypothetical protein